MGGVGLDDGETQRRDGHDAGDEDGQQHRRRVLVGEVADYLGLDRVVRMRHDRESRDVDHRRGGEVVYVSVTLYVSSLRLRSRSRSQGDTGSGLKKVLKSMGLLL